ncbi:hypothetical protein GYMLUDRAFT_95359 [Collybiopsis luxurians FD-317 M1]|uniref:Homeobox domain-containing protein n=1 Tax=Collybiopsis luxurians FD-317 M1 TaxID=944289 RepID=A0A0D0D3D3_9AGAR|nr:hypothetical protein GYMLUDRAFT_95359 [Collybiopsis luxurians FD-317 M1]
MEHVQDTSFAAPDTRPASKARLRRISREGLALLKDIWNQGVTNPTVEQKKLLLEQIQSLPGCEHYEKRNLDAFFASRRSKVSSTSKSCSESPRYSTIKTEQIESLRALFEGVKHNPSEDVITVWAELLGAAVPDIKAWVADEKESLGMSQELPPTPMSMTTSSRFPSPEQEHLVSTTLLLSPLTLPTVTPAADGPPSHPSAPLLNLPLQTVNEPAAMEISLPASTLPSNSGFHRDPISSPTAPHDTRDSAAVNPKPPEPQLSSFSWAPSLKHLLE